MSHQPPPPPIEDLDEDSVDQRARDLYARARNALPKTTRTKKKGLGKKVAIGFGIFVAWGLIHDATKAAQGTADQPAPKAPTAQEVQYDLCMKSYKDARWCYGDVYGTTNKAPEPPTTQAPPTQPPTTTPQVPTTPKPPVKPQGSKGMYFCEECPLDASEVVDGR